MSPSPGRPKRGSTTSGARAPGARAPGTRNAAPTTGDLFDAASLPVPAPQTSRQGLPARRVPPLTTEPLRTAATPAPPGLFEPHQSPAPPAAPANTAALL